LEWKEEAEVGIDPQMEVKERRKGVTDETRRKEI